MKICDVVRTKVWLICFCLNIIALNSNAQAPTIQNISAIKGPVETSVTISGSNFSADISQNIVIFGSTYATILAASSTSLTVKVPFGSTHRLIYVLNKETGLSVFAPINFVTTYRSISSIQNSNFIPSGEFSRSDFAPLVEISGVSGNNYTAVGDLDNDGKPDLITSSGASNSISIHKNKTTLLGVFTSSSFDHSIVLSTGTGSAPQYVAINDLDGDGKLDIITANSNSSLGSTISIFRNKSVTGVLDANSFETRIDMATAAGCCAQPQYLDINDLDGDGKPEIAVANRQTADVIVFKNLSIPGILNSSSFGPRKSYYGGTQPSGIRLRDLNGDQKPDYIASANSMIVILENSKLFDGSGNFSPPQSTGGAFINLPIPSSANVGVEVEDLDGDGKRDIIVNARSGNALFVFRNIHSGGNLSSSSFSPLITIPYHSQINIAMSAPEISDIDGDGKVDILLSGVTHDSVYVLRNRTSSGSITASDFSTRLGFYTGRGAFAPIAADLNGDKKPDIIVPTSIFGRVGLIQNTIRVPAITTTDSSANVSTDSAILYATSDDQNFTTSVSFEYDTDPNFSLPKTIAASSGGVLIAGAGSTSSHVSIKELNSGTRYYYRSKAVNAAGTVYGDPLNFITATTILSMQRVQDSITNRNSVDFAIEFANAINGLTSSCFSIQTTDLSGASITQIQGAGTQWIVTVTTSSGSGLVGLNFVSDVGIIPSIENSFYSSEKYYIDRQAPLVQTLKRNTPVSFFTNRSELIYQIIFSEPVLGVDVSDFIIETSAGITGVIEEVSGSGHTYFIKTKGVFANNTSIGLNLKSSGTGITDIALNPIETGFIGETYVVDNIAPTITGLSIRSNNPDSSLAKPGDQIVLRFSGNELLDTPVVLIASRSATLVNLQGAIWEASIIIPNGVTEGIINYTISCTDLAENPGNIVSTVSDNSKVFFDQTIPSILQVSIQSDYSDKGRAKVDHTISIQFSVSEQSKTPLVNIAGSMATVSHSGTNQWKAVYKMKSTDIEGLVPFSITCSDLSGNTSIPVENSTDLSKVIFDKTKPIVQHVILASDNTNPLLAIPGNTITLKFTSNETIEPPIVTIGTQVASVANMGGNLWSAACIIDTTNTDGAVTYTIQTKDLSGNYSDLVTDQSSVVFDKTLPILSSVQINFQNTLNTVLRAGDIILLSFVSSEPITIVSTTIGSVNVYPEYKGANRWQVEYTIRNADMEGTIPFTIRFKDIAGNTGIPVSQSTNYTQIVYDITQPRIVGIKRLLPVDSVTSASKISFRIFFSEAVRGLDASDFIVATTGNVKGKITGISTSTGVFSDIEVELTEFGGSIWLNVPSSNISIEDQAGNSIRGGYFEGEKYTNNYIPTFTKGKQQPISICVNDKGIDLSSLVSVADSNSNQVLQFNILSTPKFGGLQSFTLNVSANGSTVSPGPIIYNPLANGIDSLLVVVSDGLSTDSTILIITVHELPNSLITATRGAIICSGEQMPLEVTGGKKYNWLYNDTLHLLADTVGKLMVDKKGIYKVIAESEYGCKAVSVNSIQTELIQMPIAKFTVTGFCTNKPLDILNESEIKNTGIVSFLWEDDNGQVSRSLQPDFSYSSPRNISLKLRVSSDLCPMLVDSISKTIAIEGPRSAIRLPSVNAVMGVTKPVDARNIPQVKYQWVPSVGLSDSTIRSPHVNLSQEQQYLIRMTSTSGCLTIDTLTVRVFKRAAIYVANVFSPNGDGINDYVTINLVHIKQLKYFRIYNRWGNLLYETRDASKPWDGRVKGILQPLDTYVWVADAIDDVGVSLVENGNITLLR